ncbi:MAG TPA: DUF998 domain-containing protein [Solirubrobacterales bacterium]|nr:DUF998 domain-containing protein [Solirubrobacterales bacterium]
MLVHKGLAHLPFPALIWTSAVGLTIFVAMVATQGIWVVDFDPARQQVSEYVHAGAGAVAVVAFLAWAVSLMALAGATLSSAGDDRLACLQASALLCAALGVILLACFPTDRGAEIPAAVTHATAAGRVHDLASALTTVSILLAAITSAVRVRGSLGTLILGLMVLALSSSVILLALGDPLPGIRQRALLGAGCIWQATWLWVCCRASSSTLL